MGIRDEMIAMGELAKAAAHEMAKADMETKRVFLERTAERILDQKDRIAAENAKDIQAAEARGCPRPRWIASAWPTRC